MIVSAVSCGNDVTFPEPAPLRQRREHDDWVKPGKMVQLRGVAFQFSTDRMRITNKEAFGLTLLDDIWLTLSAPTAEVRTGGPYIGNGRDGWFVSLRCPVPDSISAGVEIEISYITHV